MSLGVEPPKPQQPQPVETKVEPEAPTPMEAQPVTTEVEDPYASLRHALVNTGFDVLSQSEEVSPQIGEMLSKYCKKRENQYDFILGSLLDKIRQAIQQP